MIEYLTIVEVLTLHKDQIERYGGAEGLRVLGQLEAALFRPQTGYYPVLLAESAALCESLSQIHPFVDGIKRTAFAATYTFLVINGVKITADADSLWEFLSHLNATDSFCFESLDKWLCLNTATYPNNND